MPITQHSATICAGTLELTLHEQGERLEELLAFGSRLNPRRGYLFISRVLGKHIPVRPTAMDSIHAELASAIQLLGSTAYVVGMAETAIGLGAGVSRHLAATHDDSVFHHTTRFTVATPWIRIRESHSHADTMHLAKLGVEAQAAVSEVQDLVLVDDEITTGRTLAQLARALMIQPELARVKRLHIVSLVSWLSPTARQALLDQLPEMLEVRFVQLMAGEFTFHPRPDFAPSLPDDVDTDFSQAIAHRQHRPLPIETEGLYGKVMSSRQQPPPALLEAIDITPDVPVVVFGMGEYLDAPFRLALQLEQRGQEVLFQSSTRSPIAVADAVTSRIEHAAPDAGGKRHYLYNAPARHLPLAFDGIGRIDLSRELEANHLQSFSRQACP